MTVYELINILAKYPAGAKVKIHMIKELSEMPVFDGKLRKIDVNVKEAVFMDSNNEVFLDGWSE